MNATEKLRAFRTSLFALTVVVAALLNSCSQTQQQTQAQQLPQQQIQSDGSSTVFPVTETASFNPLNLFMGIYF